MLPGWLSRSCAKLSVVLAVVTLSSCFHMGNFSIFGGGNPPLPSVTYWSAVAADLNGDGLLDIAVSYSKGDTAPPHAGVVAVYLQAPNDPGNFAPAVTYDVGNDPIALVAGDLNGDGRPDLVSVNTIMNADGIGSSSISVLLQDPANPGQFLPATNYSTGFSPVAAAIADLNGDGRPDIAVSDSTGISILLQSSSGAGQFQPLITIPVSSGGTSAVAIADLNGDGRNDIIATASDLNIFIQDPAAPGDFLAPVHYPVGAEPSAIAVRDFNADGRLDLAIANLGSADGTSPSSVSVLLQNPASVGTFLPATNYATGIRSWTIAAADLKWGRDAGSGGRQHGLV